MSGISLTLDRAWIGLWSTPSTQIQIPHLQGYPITVAYAGVTVQFAGDDYPTGFRGTSRSKSFTLAARYMSTEQGSLDALLGLFDAAHAAADSRLLLRTHAGQVAGLNDSVAVQVFGAQPTPNLGLYWDLAFTAVVVQSTLAV